MPSETIFTAAYTADIVLAVLRLTMTFDRVLGNIPKNQPNGFFKVLTAAPSVPVERVSVSGLKKIFLICSVNLAKVCGTYLYKCFKVHNKKVKREQSKKRR